MPKPSRDDLALSSRLTVSVMIVCQAERSRVCLPPESSEHCAASLVEFPPKTHGGMEMERQDGEKI